MDRPPKTFRGCALASGLVTQADLDQAAGALVGQSSPSGAQVEVGDRELADKLVELGRLTRYQANQLLAGRTKLHLSQYRILESVGHGGMGEVFKAEHMIMGRIVAVKVLPRSKTTTDAVASFMHEIRAQAKLHHENLVQAFDAGHDGQVYFLVTEYVPGTDLRRYVRSRGALDMRTAATIISQAAQGLAHAHSKGLIHRDVKPGNLLVTPGGETKVSDLGLAGWLESTEVDPRAGRVVGTADYLSPEQILSPRDVTPASDIYSLGCTLYYAVTGKVPFPGGGSRDKAKRHLEDTPLHPRLLNTELSDEFVELLADMMNKNPTERVQTADEVIRRLAPWSTDRVDVPLGETTQQPSVWRESVNPLAAPRDSDEEFATLPETEWQFDESPSQVSQGTEPFAIATQETIPIDDAGTWLPTRRQITRDQWILGSAFALAILTLLMVFFSALLK